MGGDPSEPEATEVFLKSKLLNSHGLTHELTGPQAWPRVAYLELMDANMATAQWEVRDGEGEPGDVNQAALYRVFHARNNKEMKLDSNQARKPLARFKRQNSKLGLLSS